MRSLMLRSVEALFGVPGRLGLDYVDRTLRRSALNVLALMLSVGMSVAVSGWLGSFERSLSQWAASVGVADLTLSEGSPLLDHQHVPFSAAAAERVTAVAGVQAVQRFRMFDQTVGATKLRLVATDTDVFLEYSRRRGRGWQVVDGPVLEPGVLSKTSSLLLSENGARLLHVAAGDHLLMSTPRGQVSFFVRGVVVDYTSESGAAFIDSQQFQSYWGDTAVDGMFVYVDPAQAVDTVADRIRAALGGGHSLFVTKTSAVEEHIMATMQQAFSFSGAVETMTLLIALLGVIGTMVAAVVDRKHELAVLRALGATRGQVATAIIVEAGFLGLCAATAGIALGVVECQVFLRTLLSAQTGWHVDFAFPWLSAARTAALVVATAALAGAIPARRAVRPDVIEVSAAQ